MLRKNHHASSRLFDKRVPNSSSRYKKRERETTQSPCPEKRSRRIPPIIDNNPTARRSIRGKRGSDTHRRDTIRRRGNKRYHAPRPDVGAIFRAACEAAREGGFESSLSILHDLPGLKRNRDGKDDTANTLSYALISLDKLKNKHDLFTRYHKEFIAIVNEYQAAFRKPRFIATILHRYAKRLAETKLSININLESAMLQRFLDALVKGKSNTQESLTAFGLWVS